MPFVRDCCCFGASFVCLLGATAAHGQFLPPANTAHFYVGSFNTDDIKVYDSAGSYLRSFSATGLNGPRGIVVHPQTGELFVASQLGHEIFVFDRNEHYVTQFSHGEINSPTGMALSGDGLLYVSSFNNSKVLVFDTAGTWLRSITHPDISGPNCVAFDSAGCFYVACAINDKIVKFNPDESYADTFSWPGHADSAMGIARDSADHLYVAGGNSDDIAKFTTDGVLLDVIEHPDLDGPQGVAFDDRGHLFSSSFFAPYNVVEFDTDGNHVQTITDGGLVIARSIAFVRVATGDLNEDGTVDAADLAMMLGAWGTCDPPCPADLNNDATIDAADLALLLGNWS